LYCTFVNTVGDIPEYLSDYPSLFWNYNPTHYYRTPVIPNSIPSSYKATSVCMTYDTKSIPDRIQVLSGRNRYKYMGYLSGEYPEVVGAPAKEMRYLVNGSPSQDGVSAIDGIRQYEELQGRAFPLDDSYMTLPLFGALNTTPPTDPCFPYCYSVECMSCSENVQKGHYSGGEADGEGYYSFQCFSPFAYFNDVLDKDIYGSYSNQDIPLCSVWSLVNAISNKILYSSQRIGYEPSFEAGSILNPATLNSLNPHSLTGNKQMVAWFMDRYAYAVNNWDGSQVNNGSGIGFGFTKPQVFLWDPASNNYPTNDSKWKNIFVVGNQNVLFDSGCTNTHSTPSSGEAVSQLFFLDEISHGSPTGEFQDNTSNLSRLVVWQGCKAGEAGNVGSVADISISTNSCTTPKASNWCSECTNPNQPQDIDCYPVYNMIKKFC
jgi:hypothetical protein